MLILVWVERSLHCAQVCRQSFPWPLKLMLAQAVCRRDVDLLWRLQAAQGKWVKLQNTMYQTQSFALSLICILRLGPSSLWKKESAKKWDWVLFFIMGFVFPWLTLTGLFQVSNLAYNQSCSLLVSKLGTNPNCDSMKFCLLMKPVCVFREFLQLLYL